MKGKSEANAIKGKANTNWKSKDEKHEARQGAVSINIHNKFKQYGETNCSKVH